MEVKNNLMNKRKRFANQIFDEAYIQNIWIILHLNQNDKQPN